MASYRLSSGGAIDRTQPLSFQFDGKPYSGFEGDTLASALMANGETLLGRSFKYHRPRGLVALGSAEPNALAEIGEGARREPNIQMTMVELYEGLTARSQNRFPSLKFDLLAVNQLFSKFLVAGFYYKTFMWPSAFWEPVYEKLIRRAAGLGRAADEPDPDHYEHRYAHCDVLVVGAGPAGISAANSASAAGARVLLLDENAWLGGAAAYGDDGQNYAGALESADTLQTLPRTTTLGLYDHNMVLALERVGDHLSAIPDGSPRQRLWVIRPKQIVIAAGALERPVTFDNNDKPGVMLSSAARGLAGRFAVAPGKNVAIVAADDSAYETAAALQAKGINISMIADMRDQAPDSAQALAAKGVRIATSSGPVKALGGQTVSGLRIKHGAGTEDIQCDAVLVAGGYNPNVHLLSHAGAVPVWNDAIGAFVPADTNGPIWAVGACRGIFETAACITDGEIAGAKAASAAGFSHTAKSPRPVVAPRQNLHRLHVPGKGKAFVDFQNDVTRFDIQLAAQEGYRSVEHLKRYTTLGMATDQGKTSSVNGMSVLADVLDKDIPSVGTTRFRPPYTPTAIGAFAGHASGMDFQPTRRTAFHGCHEAAGAVFVEAGQWLRPRYYPQAGEDMLAAIKREAKAVRTRVGICDVSTLGKIELFGPDAAKFLNRLYINNWMKLAVGKARYGVMLREDGCLFDDGTTSRLAEDHFFMTCTTANAARVLAHMEYASQILFPEMEVGFCSATEQWCGLALAGPHSRDVLGKLFDDLDVSDEAFPFMGVRETEFDGMPARIFRISFSGELAYEINTHWGCGEHLWKRLQQAGEPFGLTPYGTEALGVLRIEKGHIAGNEIDGRTTAQDAGLGRMMAKKDFIGKTMAQRPGMVGETRPSLVGVRPVNAGDRLRGGAHFVSAKDASAPPPIQSQGWVSSVADSPNLGHWIGLGFLERGEARIGERVMAVYPLKNEVVEVEICEPCFVDPKGERLHA